jgi:hypothetical protein
MPRPLRFIPEHSLVEITTRTLQGRLPLKPSPELTDISPETSGTTLAENTHHGWLLGEGRAALLA